eukprot:CAMPEP_0204178202 /NCGR_PEP_ID=MMETSP0361-20130328/49118_1 /ASSEMBLY_ACC=CAM_ASM_000343 /TAXON_ID=268821 /ORGANISM="Scrippsiella Hangoei, Strain SHTV-5" /LENGTH=236 /DNA_ID=CAMNT_0051137289 /DNA_START=68 /DNA_END=779 /DNA_ORIENTATION=+
MSDLHAVDSNSDRRVASTSTSKGVKIAAERGHVEALRALLLLPRGLAALAGQPALPEALAGAARRNQRQTVGLLLCARAAVDATTTTDPRFAAWYAAFHNAADVLQELIGARADIDKKRSDEGSTPLYIAAQENSIQVYVAASSNSSQALEMLLGSRADVDRAKDNGCTPVYVAAQLNHSQALKLLIEHRADINKPANWGDTPVMIAVEEGHSEAQSLLLAAGATLPEQGAEGEVQ